ncbi:hypothetical protein BDY19DRAFT_991016 [Irpex rosettiformis]|uniref:Uncharacterized protein n=1 Tax=Irpex rosettiformis TaxID=378272 RepID=A0ACB8UDI7_9APHY|nr:hypothetical protein BDY19DRAFT_991016 [Irpex rosettiformis]
MQYHSTADYPNCPLHGLVVPQAVHRASPPYPSFPPIMFYEGQSYGASLQGTLNGLSAIPDRDVRPTTTATSTKIKIRLSWPGYMEFSKDINAKEHNRAGNSIPKWKLALCVAQVVNAFYSANVDAIDHHGDWDIRRIPFERLRLLELRQVSTGSWQPSDHHSFVDSPNASGYVVPQMVYQVPGSENNLGPAISFVQHGQPGVLVGQAIRPTFCRGDPASTGMLDGNVEVDVRYTNPMIKIRIEWPGCQPYALAISFEEKIEGVTRTRRITKGVLAHRVSGVIERFRHEFQRSDSWRENEAWAPNRFELGRFVIHELRNVAIGSYQPVIVISAP